VLLLLHLTRRWCRPKKRGGTAKPLSRKAGKENKKMKQKTQVWLIAIIILAAFTIFAGLAKSAEVEKKEAVPLSQQIEIKKWEIRYLQEQANRLQSDVNLNKVAMATTIKALKALQSQEKAKKEEEKKSEEKAKKVEGADKTAEGEKAAKSQGGPRN
jgi:hypothetical protein